MSGMASVLVVASPWYKDAANISSVVAVIGTLVGALTATSAFRLQTRAASKAVPQKRLEDRLEELSKSMRNSARLVEQVSAELDARAALAKQLQEEAEAAQALAALHKEQADAIRHLLDTELEGSEKRIRRDAIVIGIGSFIAGGGISFLITLLVHPLH